MHENSLPVQASSRCKAIPRIYGTILDLDGTGELRQVPDTLVSHAGTEGLTRHRRMPSQPPRRESDRVRYSSGTAGHAPLLPAAPTRQSCRPPKCLRHGGRPSPVRAKELSPGTTRRQTVRGGARVSDLGL